MSNANPISIILTKQEINNFWKHVDKTEGLGPQGQCWEWTGGRATPNPYGVFNVKRDGKRRAILAHRLAYYLQKDNPNYLLVCHHCDNHPCVRGDHLFLGTYQDNRDDCVSKNRQFRGRRTNIENFKRGETVHCAKLSGRQVEEIVNLQQQGFTASQISRLNLYPVSRRAIAYIIEGQTWKHV